MVTPHAHDEFAFDPDEDLFDDPFDVVMYDIDAAADDVYALIAMLGDDDRSWYAKRRLNALAASGPLSALVADIIIDSLGRRWDPLRHPRDRYGRFINTGGFLRWLAGASGEWLRGQVSRIDSDGNIHVRSVGNDRVPDGTVYRFKPEMASKLVSTESPVATLEDIDLDADIPEFPEASPVQKRIWNNLADGDIPAEDLDRALADLDLSVEDFAGEVQGLESRGLIEIDRSGDKPRVRRAGAEEKAAIDVGDDEIGDVPDDDTPDLDDSPAFTRNQRALLDSLADADAGDGDGVSRETIGVEESEESDLQALIDAGAVTEGDNGNLYLENPEGDDAAPEGGSSEPDVGQEIFDAAANVSDDPDVQEAFQHYAEELARPGDENNIPLPEELAPAKRRNAEAAANQWWDERNADTPSADDATPDTNAPEDVAPDAEQPNASNVVDPNNQAKADQLAAQWFDAEFLDSNDGVEYRNALKKYFDAEDYDNAGDADRARFAREDADRALRNINGVSEEDIAGWPNEVRDFRDNVDQAPVSEAGPLDRHTDIPAEASPDTEEMARIREQVHQNLNRDVQAPVSPDNADVQQAPDAGAPDANAVDPNVPEASPRGEWDVKGERNFQPENIGILVDGENWRDQEQANDAVEVGQAMWDAQNNYKSVDEAYDIAAEKVRSGKLTQSDLEDIQSGVQDHLESRGQKWNRGLEIDHVGDDQRRPDAPEAPAIENVDQAGAPLGSLVPIAESPEHSKAINQPLDFVDMGNLADDGFALDHNGQRAQVGNWYRADAGGEGDPGQLVGFYDQDKYPGWAALVMPDGKVKGVQMAGMNQIAPRDANEWRAQRAVRNRDQGTIGKGMPELDQFHRMLQIKDANDPNGAPVQAKLGQRVVSNSGGQKFPRGEEGVITRFGWDAAKNRPIIFVVRPGAQGQRDEIGLAPKAVQFKNDTPVPSPKLAEDIASPDLPNLDIPDKEWPVPSDAELLDRLQAHGEPDMINFINGFQNPGVVWDQLNWLVNADKVEVVPDPEGGRAKIRVAGDAAPDAVPSVPDLPNGANDSVDAELLNAIDAAGEAGLGGGDLVDVDAEDAADKMVALREMVNRGVLRRDIDPDTGKPVFRRAPQVSNSPKEMSNEEAVNALRSGEDPLHVANTSLESALRDAGFKVIPNGEAAAAGAVSPNNWFISPRSAEFPVRLKNHGREDGRVYMVKKSSGSESIPNDVMNEVMAGAISEDLQEALGREQPGLLFHPRVGLAAAPRGLGGDAGGAIIMDHAAYGYPEGYKFYSGRDLDDTALRAGNASDDIIGLALYDFIINNDQDRHRNNQMYVQDPVTGDIQAVVIDNGYGFGAGGGGDNYTFDQYARSWRPSDLLKRARRRERERVEDSVRRFAETYNQMDVESVMERIRSKYPEITPEQEAYARRWIEIAKSRASSIALDIDGVVDTIMGL